jgi:hypothetical protein
MAGRPYNYDQKQINFLYYPSEPEDYQRLFLKMEVFSDRSQKRIADSIIYLPLPLGLLREESATTWDWREYEIAGEAGKAISNYMKNDFNFETYRNYFGRIEQLGGNISKAFNTFLETELQRTELSVFEALRQGAGFSRRPNITYIFQNISALRNFRLDWKLHPKTKKDGKMAEKIISEIQKAALPSVSDMSAYREIGYFFGKERPSNDQIGKNDVEIGRDFEHKLYSTTFRAPKEFKLSVVERQGENYGNWNQLENIVDFPIPFVLEDVTVQLGGEDAEADTFIKEGDEYFTASYFVSLGYLELTHYKADNVQDYKTF